MFWENVNRCNKAKKQGPSSAMRAAVGAGDSPPTAVLERELLDLELAGEAEAEVSSETEHTWVIQGVHLGRVLRPLILYRIHPDVYDHAKKFIRLFS